MILSPIAALMALNEMIEEWLSPDFLIARDAFIDQMGLFAYVPIFLVEVNDSIEDFILEAT